MERNATSRLKSIDQFRGLAIVLMVPANYLADVVWIPPSLKHAPDVGLTVIDLVAPMFMFAVGLTYRSSFLRRAERDGAAKAYGHFIERWAALIGIGAIFSAGEVATGHGVANWGVLQAIGASGLLALPMISLPARYRFAAGLVLLTAYEIILDASWRDLVLHSSHGGLLGVPGWAAMLLLASALADVHHASRRGSFALWSAAAILVGLALASIVPISKNRVSASYVLVTLGTSAALFAVFDLLEDPVEWAVPNLGHWGRNALVMYVLHLFFLGVFVMPGIAWWHAEAPGWLVGVQLAGILVGLGAIATALHRRGWIFAL